ncbi:MAG: carbohydrate ABC transporter permease [Angustibacter sp.]
MAVTGTASLPTRTRPPAGGRVRGGVRRADRRRAGAGLAMLTPAIVFLAVFLVLPLGLMVWTAFTNQVYPANPIRPERFVGWDNFRTLLADLDFRQALTHNVLFTVVIVPVQTALALGLALLVNAPVRGRAFFRVCFFLPLAVPVAVSGMLWKYLFDSGGVAGRAVQFLSFGHLTPDWFVEPRWTQLAVVIVSLWSSTGFQMIILLAALQGVPRELHEAAMLDGAGAWQRFLAVTLPSIRHQLYFVVAVTTILSFRLFDTVWVLPPRPGEPLGATTTLMQFIVERAQRFPALIGLVSAASVLFLVVVLIVALVQRRLEPRE